MTLKELYASHRQKLAALADTAGAPLGELLRPVYGSGDPCSPIVLIGEAPGRFETEAGEPFVGKAGQNLTELLSAAGIDRRELYITNAVKYRPYAVNEKGGKRNRTPTRAELKAGRELLFQELALIAPRLIVTLGNSPLYALTGKADIGGSHGVAQPFETAALFPLYHPASLIYNPALKNEYQQDLERLYQYIHSPEF